MMKTDEISQSKWQVLGSTIIFMLLGLASIYFAFTVTKELYIDFSQKSNVIIFNKAGFYFYGVALVLLVFPSIVIYTKVFRLTISKQKETWLNYVLLFGLIITFAVPHITHNYTDSIMNKYNYQKCRDKSDRALYIVTVVYAKNGRCNNLEYE